jgi:photosystem II stability/assembly factor-like uncharacterized protein
MLRALVVVTCIASAQTWELRSGSSTASMRGLSAVSSQVAWVSGTKGTILRTVDGGATWQNAAPDGVSDLDFRDIEALNDRVAFALSSGEGRASRLFKTTDGGASWYMLRANQDPNGFWDAIAMWDATHGLLAGDPIDGRFVILATNDGGVWVSMEGPKAEKGEALFAASGTSLIARGTREAWFATGGTGGSRVFHTEDGGKSWDVVRTPVKPAGDSSGIFSLAFAGTNGVAVGGDYMQPNRVDHSVAVTEKRVWIEPAGAPGGYRSAVVYAAAREMWIAAGPSGTDVSDDNGHSWRAIDRESFHTLSVAPDGSVWAAGANGRIARLKF